MEKNYRCKAYFPIKGILYAFVVVMIVVAFLIIVSRFLDNAFIGVAGFIILLILPFRYQQRVKNLFTENVLIAFNSNGFSITYNSKRGNAGIQFYYSWQNIQSYRFDFTPSQFTVMDIYFKNGGGKKFVFIEDKKEIQSIDEENLFAIFRRFVMEFNKNNNEKILVSPGFLVTSIGTALLFLPGILIITAIVIRINYNNNYYLGFLIFGIVSFIPLLIRRIEQKNLYKRISDLNDL